MMTMEQTVSQLQQELFTLNAQVAARAQIAAAVQVVNNLTTAQVRRDPSESHLGRPKEFSGKEEDFQQALFSGVMKEFEMMLEWASEQRTEISTELIDQEFLPIMTNQERGVQNLEFILQQMHTMLADLTSGEANDVVAQIAEETLGGVATTAEEIRSYNRRTEEKPPSQCRFSGTRCSLLELQA